MKRGVSVLFGPSSDQVVSKLIDGEVIVINLTSGVYYSMDQVAAKIWRELCVGSTKSAVLDELAAAYPNQDDAAHQAEAFIARLVSAGLLSEVLTPKGPVEEFEAMSWPSEYVAPDFLGFDDVAEMVALDPPLPELQGYATDR